MSTENHDGFLDRVIRESFRRIDHRIQIKTLPPKRAVRDLETGKIDGQYFRVKRAIEKDETILMVSHPLFQINIVVVADKSANFQPNGWQSLAPLEFAYYRDAKHISNRVAQFSKKYDVPKNKTIFDMMAADRLDYGVVPYFLARQMLKNKEYSGLKILEPALETLFGYLYLSGKNRPLEAPLSKAIAAMVKDGTMRRLCPRCGF